MSNIEKIKELYSKIPRNKKNDLIVDVAEGMGIEVSSVSANYFSRFFIPKSKQIKVIEIIENFKNKEKQDARINRS